jgi:hypothetical protein
MRSRQLFALAALVLVATTVLEGADLALMPRVEDYTLMNWAEGFPGHTPAAPWQRCIRTGYYAIVMDTRTLTIPHFGPLPGGVSYSAAARDDNRVWRHLAGAELALTIGTGGKKYRCTSGGAWSDFQGPRLVESGRFLQRADVTDLAFSAEDGTRLNVEARFETAAWPDRLALILAARPGLQPIPAGETCFGRVGGGFGLDGTNHWEVPHRPELDPPVFTLELWAFVPTDYQASERVFPWLVCKNHHEQAEGNYGIVILNGRPQARLNIGGGRDNMFLIDATVPLRIDAWNHLAISYDGDALRFYVNGAVAGDQKVGRQRVPGHEGLAFGRRQDNWGDGYHFRGVIDEIRLYDFALTPAQVRERYQQPDVISPAVKPMDAWSFRTDGQTAQTRPVEQWTGADLKIQLTAAHGLWQQRRELPPRTTEKDRQWQEVSLALQPGSLEAAEPTSTVKVQAREYPGGSNCPVDFDEARGWHRVGLDGIEPVVPSGGADRQNDAIERVKLVLANTANDERIARLLFEKTAGGFRHRFGVPISGMSAVLRDANGQPTGIPVQLSKNWHGRPEGGVYAGLWFHGFTQVRLQPQSEVELELALVYGHWGGVAAASHAQLCLIGWGSNQLWNQSALGSWGESICYEPDQVQAQCSVLDVRPLMVRSMAADQPWEWTHNVGGGDFFRLFNAGGQRVPHTRMHTAYERYGPCLTEVTYAGRITDGVEHSATVSLARTDDIVRGTYRLQLNVTTPTDFSRFVIFQIGADTYGYTGERKMALGNETGLLREWPTQWGGNTYRTAPLECTGRVPWISLHEAVSRAKKEAAVQGQQDAPGAWANRGIVIRSWQARLGGRPASPWMAEHGVRARGEDTSTADITPPPGVTRLEPGDFVEATIEHVIVPQYAADYYGPNEALRTALGQWENTWQMTHREAVGNDRRVDMQRGTLTRLYSDVRVHASEDGAEFTLTGGLGYVPVTFTGLTSPRDRMLTLDNRPVNQAVHGNDFWQTDYDPETKSWSQTYNIPIGDKSPHIIRLERVAR